MRDQSTKSLIEQNRDSVVQRRNKKSRQGKIAFLFGLSFYEKSFCRELKGSDLFSPRNAQLRFIHYQHAFNVAILFSLP